LYYGVQKPAPLSGLIFMILQMNSNGKAFDLYQVSIRFEL